MSYFTCHTSLVWVFVQFCLIVTCCRWPCGWPFLLCCQQLYWSAGQLVEKPVVVITSSGQFCCLESSCDVIISRKFTEPLATFTHNERHISFWLFSRLNVCVLLSIFYLTYLYIYYTYYFIIYIYSASIIHVIIFIFKINYNCLYMLLVYLCVFLLVCICILGF